MEMDIKSSRRVLLCGDSPYRPWPHSLRLAVAVAALGSILLAVVAGGAPVVAAQGDRGAVRTAALPVFRVIAPSLAWEAFEETVGAPAPRSIVVQIPTL